MPADRFPPRFAELGFTPRQNGGEFIVPPVCDVPAGQFLMGSGSKRDDQAYIAEQPQHRVTLPAYQISRYPVTVAEYACFIRAGHMQPAMGVFGVDWPTQLTRLDHPVTCVTWHDAVAYAAWLYVRTGQPWRLPSEAEWEKAARGTDGRIYPWGNSFDTARCNSNESGIQTTTPVDRYPGGTSPYGALDLAGNVWEWTASVFAPYPYRPNTGREAPDSPGARVLRGGSWVSSPQDARAAYRTVNDRDNFIDHIGFRLLRAVAGS
jgi:formylglycine-generating enzyme required for sulfatase activity